MREIKEHPGRTALDGAPASVSSESTHFDLSDGLAAFGPARGGVSAALSWRGVALGHLELEARPRPMSEETLAGAVLEAIAPALDAYLMGGKIGPRRELKRADSNADPRRLLRAALSLLDHRPILAPRSAAEDLPAAPEPPDDPPSEPPSASRKSLLPKVALTGLLGLAAVSCLSQSFTAIDVVPMLLALVAAGVQVVAAVHGRPANVPAHRR